MVAVDQLLTIAQAARRSRYLSEAALRGQVALGNLEPTRVGGRLFVTIKALDAYLRAREAK
jgi:hypothetical protein